MYQTSKLRLHAADDMGGRRFLMKHCHSPRQACFWISLGILCVLVYRFATRENVDYEAPVWEVEDRVTSAGCLRCHSLDNRAVVQAQATATFSKKVNDNGTFLPYPGYSVLSLVSNRDAEFIAAELNKLKVLRNYIAFVPRWALHVSIFHIISSDKTFDQGKPSWVPKGVESHTPVALRGEFLQVINEGQALCDNLDQSIEAELGAVKMLSEPGYTIQVPIRLKNSRWSSELMASLARVFHNVGTKRDWRMTLGYTYRRLPSTRKELDEVFAELAQLKNALLGLQVRLTRPQVHVIHDVGCYTPYPDFRRACLQVQT